MTDERPARRSVRTLLLVVMQVKVLLVFPFNLMLHVMLLS